MGQKSLNGSVLWEDEVQLPSSVPANIWGPGCSTTAPGYMLILFNSLMQKLVPVLTGLWSASQEDMRGDGGSERFDTVSLSKVLDQVLV